MARSPAVPLSLARDVDVSAVKLDEVADDRESEPEPAGLLRGRSIRLAKAVEDEGKEFGRDAFARVGDADADPGVGVPHVQTYRPAVRRELGSI